MAGAGASSPIAIFFGFLGAAEKGRQGEAENE
jgi:hypothetical protein